MQIATLRTRNPVRSYESSLWAKSAMAREAAIPPRCAPAIDAEIVHLIDDAQSGLSHDDFVAALTVLRRETDLLRGGRIPARPRGRLREPGDLTAAAREHLRPIRLELGRVARYIDVSGGSLVALGERVAGYIETVGPFRTSEVAA